MTTKIDLTPAYLVERKRNEETVDAVLKRMGGEYAEAAKVQMGTDPKKPGLRMIRRGLELARQRNDIPAGKAQQMQLQYRSERLQKLGDGPREALKLAEATLAERDRVTSLEAVLKGARFIELLMLEKNGSDFWSENQERAQMNESRENRELLMTYATGAELRVDSDSEMAARVVDAAAAGNLKMLKMARKEWRLHPTGSMPETHQALITALNIDAKTNLAQWGGSVAKPEWVQKLDAAYDSCEARLRLLVEALSEIDSGRVQDIERNIQRQAELIPEHGDLGSATRVNEERQQERRALEEAARKLADNLVAIARSEPAETEVPNTAA